MPQTKKKFYELSLPERLQDLARESGVPLESLLPLSGAGGLTPENVVEAIRRARPYAVDVSSGVETAPGKKDHSRLRGFIQAAKSVEG